MQNHVFSVQFKETCLQNQSYLYLCVAHLLVDHRLEFFLTCYIKKLQTYKCRRSAIHCVVEILKTKYINMLISCV
jgi:hypothetical protein